jgi:hypothetical protein
MGLPEWVNHISFRSPNLEHMREKRDLWLANGYDVMEIDHNWCHSVYTRDPNGTLVEYCVTTGAFTEEDARMALKAVVSDDLPPSPPPKSIVMHKSTAKRTAKG